jgi:hypothetical protein
MKNSWIPAGIEPATFWFVAQHLNHCATAVPVTSELHVEIYDNKQNDFPLFIKRKHHVRNYHSDISGYKMSGTSTMIFCIHCFLLVAVLVLRLRSHFRTTHVQVGHTDLSIYTYFSQVVSFPQVSKLKFLCHSTSFPSVLRVRKYQLNRFNLTKTLSHAWAGITQLYGAHVSSYLYYTVLSKIHKISC